MAHPHEVSSRVTDMFLRFVDQEPELAPKLVGLDLAAYRGGADWLSWEQYMDLLEAVGGRDLEAQREIGRRYMRFGANTPLRHLGMLAGGGGRKIVEAVYGWILEANLSVVRSRVEHRQDGLFDVTIDLDPELDRGEIFLHSTWGTAEGLPYLLGQATADVRAEITPHRARFELRLPLSTDLSSRLRRAWHSFTDVDGVELAVDHMRQALEDNVRSLKEANEALQLSDARWRGLMAALPGVVAVVDAEGMLVQHGGARFPDGIPDGGSLLALAPEQQRPALRAALERALSGVSIEGETQIPSRAGGVRHWHYHASLLDGAEPLVVVVAIDVSERQRAQDALRQRERELHRVQRSDVVARLAGGLAHDVNNQLTAVRAHAELLDAARPDDARVSRAVDEILAAVDRAGSLTRRLLSSGVVAQGAPRGVDLNGIVADGMSLLQSVLGPQVTLRSRLAAGPTIALVDPGQAEQALLNLVINARDALPEGGTITLATRVVGGRVELSVEDDGLGMSAEVRDRATEPFFSTKPPGVGSGLGLASVSAFVDASGGELAIDSAIGKGCVVRLVLPQARRVEPTPAPPERGSVFQARGEHLMLVEDDASLRELFRGMLADLGYRVTACADAHEATGALREHPDLALLVTDIAMPGPSGLDLARTVLLERPELPVLLISGFTAEDPRVLADFTDRYAFLAKPFGREALSQAVRSLLVQ